MSQQGKRASSRRPIALLLSVTIAISSWRLASAVLVQPHNYLLDDSPLTNQHDHSGSLSPFFNDANAGPEQQDKDIVSIISDSLNRLRFARMLDQQQNEHEQVHGLSPEMAELISEQQAKAEAANGEQPSLSSSVASMLMNAAQSAAAAASAQEEQTGETAQQSSSEPASQMSQRGQIMELDTSQAQGAQAAAQPSKADLKQPIQWYNPKETIPVLKISSMATPSKYKKVYFRSEKKLVDGAFHSPSSSEQADKKPAGLALKSFGHSASSANVQRRSSRGSGSSAPPSVLQDGVIDFLKKFRDVYVQTRPVGQQAAASSPSNPLNFASSVISAAASSPLASFLAPASSSGSRPNLMGALSTASQMVSGAQALAQASPASSGASSPASGASSGGAGAAAGSAAAATTGAAASGSKPLTAQSYVSFWSKTFPTWVRKMLKQMRRRSLYNSSKRQQQQHAHHSHHHGIGQKSASVPSAISSDSNSSSQSSSQSSSSSS